MSDLDEAEVRSKPFSSLLLARFFMASITNRLIKWLRHIVKAFIAVKGVFAATGTTTGTRVFTIFATFSIASMATTFLAISIFLAFGASFSVTAS
ncbi:hypothetical protein [Endozoicomonas sp. ALD040]|uniref:hypothetical protein n=1 Tax=Endozoicomonas sp. ALD040 TaxID=3403079 RepID=UPI003BAEF532